MEQTTLCVVSRRRQLLSMAQISLLLFSLAGCANVYESEDFDRHRLSRLTIPYDARDTFFFDVTLSPELPDEDPLAESRRLAWLQTWIESREEYGVEFPTDSVDRRQNFEPIIEPRLVSLAASVVQLHIECAGERHTDPGLDRYLRIPVSVLQQDS